MNTYGNVIYSFEVSLFLENYFWSLLSFQIVKNERESGSPLPPF